MTLIERVDAAMKQDYKIACFPEQVDKHPGSTLEYLESLGLSKRDLKKLEKFGLAVRGRTWNYDYQLGKHLSGEEVRWIIVARRPVTFVGNPSLESKQMPSGEDKAGSISTTQVVLGSDSSVPLVDTEQKREQNQPPYADGVTVGESVEIVVDDSGTYVISDAKSVSRI